MKPLQAQRRLVKSPPELWAELSDETTLGARFGAFGDIRITRAQPETTVAWEGEHARGTVELEPSGWGTKVVLTVDEIAPTVVVEGEPEGLPPAAEPEPVETRPAAEPEPAREPVAARPAAAAARPPAARSRPPAPRPEAPPRRGLVARLFGWLAAKPAVAETPGPPTPGPPVPGPDPSPPVPGPDPSPPQPEPPQPGPPPPGPKPAPDPRPPAPAPDPTPPVIGPPAAGPTTSEAPPLDAERTLEILAEVLDDLGAAHHRPFSRE